MILRLLHNSDGPVKSRSLPVTKTTAALALAAFFDGLAESRIIPKLVILTKARIQSCQYALDAGYVILDRKTALMQSGV